MCTKALGLSGIVERVRQTEIPQRQDMERTRQGSMIRRVAPAPAVVLGHCVVLDDVVGGKFDSIVVLR